MRSLQPVTPWLDALASDAPSPGGGAAAALNASMGASLVCMVCNLTLGKEAFADHQATLLEVLAKAEAGRHRALALAEADAAAFSAYMATAKLPRSTPAERAAKAAATKAALLGAARVPLDTALLAAEIIGLCELLLGRSNPHVISDVAVAAQNARCALDASLVNVEINLASMKDADQRATLAAELATATPAAARADAVVAEVRAEVNKARSLPGLPLAKAIFTEAKPRVAALRTAGVAPTLAVVVPTDDGATAAYVRSIVKAAERWNLSCRVVTLDQPDGPTLFAALDALSADDSVHGILCQTPLPAGVSLEEVGQHIVPRKDVDGANPVSLGRLAAGLPAFPPATAEAVVEVLVRNDVPLQGKDVVVVGRSTVVGKPAALLLLGKNATVTVCHSRTRDLAATCRKADVVVAAVGRAGLLGADHVRPGAVVIDVGTNPTDDGGLVGDVDAAAVRHASALTPVPGGVGRVTTALLLQHVVTAAESSQG